MLKKLHQTNTVEQKVGIAVGNAQQSTVDMAIEQWRGRRKACVCAKGGHFEHSL